MARPAGGARSRTSTCVVLFCWLVGWFFLLGGAGFVCLSVCFGGAQGGVLACALGVCVDATTQECCDFSVVVE